MSGGRYFIGDIDRGTKLALVYILSLPAYIAICRIAGLITTWRHPEDRLIPLGSNGLRGLKCFMGFGF